LLKAGCSRVRRSVIISIRERKMKKIVVPDEMLMAARKRWPESATGEAVIRDRIEAALQWWLENVQFLPPNERTKIAAEIFAENPYVDFDEKLIWFAEKWLERMFLAPEPKPEVSFDEIWNSLTVEINRLGMGAALEVLKRTS
jgi:hypothetical protein